MFNKAEKVIVVDDIVGADEKRKIYTHHETYVDIQAMLHLQHRANPRTAGQSTQYPPASMPCQYCPTLSDAAGELTRPLGVHLQPCQAEVATHTRDAPCPPLDLRHLLAACVLNTIVRASMQHI